MKLMHMFLILIITLTSYTICSVEAAFQSELLAKEYRGIYNHDMHSPPFIQNLQMDGRFNIFRPVKRTRRATCKNSPRVCGLKGSPGPSCCNKKCVNLRFDGQNCGKCGNKCRFSQICCGGKCVDPAFSKRHCGGCNNKCGSGGLCAFGLCSYA